MTGLVSLWKALRRFPSAAAWSSERWISGSPVSCVFVSCRVDLGEKRGNESVFFFKAEKGAGTKEKWNKALTTTTHVVLALDLGRVEVDVVGPPRRRVDQPADTKRGRETCCVCVCVHRTKASVVSRAAS